MSSYDTTLKSAHAVIYFVISPLALLADILAIFVIAHYFPYYHGTGVALISVISAMVGNTIVALPIPTK